MPLLARCSCSALLEASEDLADRRGLCPACGATVLFAERAPPRRQPAAAPALVGAEASALERDAVSAEIVEPTPAAPSAPAADLWYFDEPIEVHEFLDPPPEKPPLAQAAIPPISPAAASPSADHPPAPADETPWAAQALQALLDPAAIQWMLMLGGGLMVVGIIVWLISLGIFQVIWENKLLVATIAAGASVALLAAGWWTRLRTSYHTAGRAITFLACVVLPLNLWLCGAQEILTLEGQLWLGALACTVLYVATVYALRDPLFLYAVEIGVTLTVVLLLLGPLAPLAETATGLSLIFLVLALLSIHLERAFLEEGEFRREEFGLPLFWSGQVQLAAAVSILLGSQLLAWLMIGERLPFVLDWSWRGNPLSDQSLLAAGIWGAAGYAYLYSDLAVRRVGYYFYPAALCLFFAATTLLAPQRAEVVMIALAAMALAASLAQRALREENRLGNALAPLAILLGALPLAMGLVLHLHASEFLPARWWWGAETAPALFVLALAAVAAANRVAAFVYDERDERLGRAFHLFTGLAVLIGAAGLLRLTGIPELTRWEHQAVLLQLIPIAYLLASRVWRGRPAEESLGVVAHVGAVLILASGLFSQLRLLETFDAPGAGLVVPHLLLALLFGEVAVFYALATWFRRRSVNLYFATAALCLALWQIFAWGQVDAAWYTLLYAGVGTALLVAARLLGLSPTEVYTRTELKSIELQGPGETAFQCGNAVLLMAGLAAGWMTLLALLQGPLPWHAIGALYLTVGCALVAMVVVPSSGWRQCYVILASSLGVLGLLHLNLMLNFSPWQKFEVLCVAAGAFVLFAAHVMRLRQGDAKDAGRDDAVPFGMAIGSLLLVVPLTVAMIAHRATTGVSLGDELALLTASVLLLLSGVVLRIRGTTIVGGAALSLYLLVLVGTALYLPQVTMGAYLAIGGGLLFAGGVALSVYRDRLLALPEQIRTRQGLFQVLDWR